jgi:hypothetical protein
MSNARCQRNYIVLRQDYFCQLPTINIRNLAIDLSAMTHQSNRNAPPAIINYVNDAMEFPGSNSPVIRTLRQLFCAIWAWCDRK